MQNILRTHSKMVTFEKACKKKMENWSLIDTLMCFRHLERECDRRLVNTGVQNIMNNMKDAMKLEGSGVMITYEKELRLFLNYFLNNRTDKQDEPTRKKGANTPPVRVWRQMSEHLRQPPAEASLKKKLRSAQANLALVVSRACGARLSEIVRLKFSDLQLVENGRDHRFLSICVRRGKSCPKGFIPTYYRCYKNNEDKILCPIRALKNYMKTWCMILNQDAGNYVLPSSIDYQQYNISEKAITDRWNSMSKELKLPKEHHIQAHSGHKMFVMSACALGCTENQILEATNWSSLKVLPMYVEGKTEANVSKRLSMINAIDLDKKLSSLQLK